jgi:replication factor C small subunit
MRRLWKNFNKIGRSDRSRFLFRLLLLPSRIRGKKMSRQQSILDALPWVELYRPQTFEDVVGQDAIVNDIKKQLHNLPHMIFSGPCGTGKTTLAQIIVNTLGADTLVLNGSEDNGIDIVRLKIDKFVKHMSLTNKAPFKIVWIDEADNLSDDMMKALRAKIEKYTFNSRFILAVNYESKVIEPLMSRFQKYTFRPITEQDIVKRLRQIAKAEHLKVTDDQLLEIAEISRGDIRKAINHLQRGNFSKSEGDKPQDELDKIFAVARA